jgi:CheY-like chemotaxis protein
MTKSTLVIWNDDDVALAMLGQLKIWQERFEKLLGTVVIVTNKEDYERLLQKQGYGYQRLFIMPEISWYTGKRSNLDGYKLFKDLISKIDKTDFSVLFCSALDRKTLFNYAKDSKLIVKKFPHAQFNNTFTSNITNAISFGETKLNLLLHQCFSIGFIDKLIHDLRGSDIEKQGAIYNYNNRLKNFLEEVHLAIGASKSFDKLALITQELDTYKNSGTLNIENFNVIKQRFSNTLEEILLETSHSEDEISSFLDGIRILVIEDDVESLESIKQWLERHKATVTCESSGVVALENYVKKTDFSSNFDVLITDLELLDNDLFDENIQGIDIIEFCQKNKPEITLRVLTGMPKRTVSKYISNVKVIFKGKASEIVPKSDSLEYIVSIKEEYEYRNELNKIGGPINGIPNKFLNKIYLSHCVPYVPKIIENTTQFFNVSNNDFKLKGSLSLKKYGWNKPNLKNSEIIKNPEIIVLFLTHRLIVILEAFVLNGGGCFNYISLSTNLKWMNSKSKEFVDLSLPIDAFAYLNNSLGFKLEDQQGEKPKVVEDIWENGTGRLDIQISSDNWYAHEVEFVKELINLDSEERLNKYGF